MAEPQGPPEFAFTVFTPTYNRAHTLPRVYHSLVAQTFRNFEWIIVDDGSTDETERLVAAWIPQAGFPIRYFRQPNSGKHVAFNRAVREAQGQLFLSFDSDDTCVSETLEKFWRYWCAIPESERNRFSTLSVLCMTSKGEVIGKRYPQDVYDAHTFQEQFAGRDSERWGVNRTDILKTMPYEEFPGEKFIPEGCVWNRLSARYSTRFVNEPLRIYEAGSDSLSTDTIALRARNPRGSCKYYAELSGYPLPFRERVKALISYARFAFHAGKNSLQTVKSVRGLNRRALLTVTVPFAYIYFRLDRIRIEKRSKL
jgi:glycosyltransferase involved in cell wall biosynthesis